MSTTVPLPPRAGDDPKCQPGAYLTPNAHLYCVIQFHDKGADYGSVTVENCKTGYIVMLRPPNIEVAVLIKPAPSLVVPDVIPDGE